MQEFVTAQCFPYYNKDLPKKTRKVAWKYRAGYVALNAVLLFWILGLSDTCLWIRPLHYLAPDDAEADASQFVQFFIVLGLSWFSYVLIQGSNPGFVEKEMLRHAGFDPDTGRVSLQNRDIEDTVSLTSPSTEMKLEVEMTNISSSKKSSSISKKETETMGLLDDMEHGSELEDEEDEQRLEAQVRA